MKARSIPPVTAAEIGIPELDGNIAAENNLPEMVGIRNTARPVPVEWENWRQEAELRS
jgi:hypothetical protein